MNNCNKTLLNRIIIAEITGLREAIILAIFVQTIAELWIIAGNSGIIEK